MAAARGRGSSELPSIQPPSREHCRARLGFSWETSMAHRIRRLAVIALALSVVLAGPAGGWPPLLRPAAPPAVPPAEPAAELTETVGLLSGLYLYQTYLNV